MWRTAILAYTCATVTATLAQSLKRKISFALSFLSVLMCRSLTYLWSWFRFQLLLFLFADICISLPSLHLLIESSDPFLCFSHFCLFIVLFLTDWPFAMIWLLRWIGNVSVWSTMRFTCLLGYVKVAHFTYYSQASFDFLKNDCILSILCNFHMQNAGLWVRKSSRI